MSKKTVSLAVTLSFAAVLIAAAPAFAQNAPQGFGGFGHGGNGVLGTVSAISGDTLTVTSKTWGGNNSSSTVSTTYTVNATNATVTKSGSSSSVSAIAVGDNVMVQGTVSGTTVTATKISDGFMGGQGMVGRGVFGTVSAINGSTLTVTSSKSRFGNNSTGATYTVNAASASVTKNGSASSVSAIAVGDTVMVQGTVSGTTVTATKINDGVVPGMGKGPGGAGNQGNPITQGNGQPVIGGTISAISGDSLTVTNKSSSPYSVDATNATVVKNNATSSVASLTVGDSVIVQGSVNGNSVAASSIIDHSAPAQTSSGSTTSAKPQRPGFFGSIGSFFKRLFGF